MGNGKRKSAAEVQVIFIFIHQGSSLSLQAALHKNIRWWVGSACYSQLQASQSLRYWGPKSCFRSSGWNNPFLEIGKIHLKGCGTSGICRMSWSWSYHVYYHKAEAFSTVAFRPLTFAQHGSDFIFASFLHFYPSPPFTPHSTPLHIVHHRNSIS